LGQLILNLAKNGLESMADASVPRHLHVHTLRHAANEVEIRVADSGSGLPEQLALDVITPFFTTKPNGLGMGLVICRTIVENHGGRLWASPNQPCGTEFHVVLPLPTAA
jgi:C4-dicarboxylate-specific signal transduction histidine kinase